MNDLANEHTGWLEPAYEAKTRTVRYPVVGESTETLGTLFDRGLLRREFAERVIACPDCGTDRLGFELQCPGCRSENTVEIDIYEHTACGCVRPREAFDEAGVDRCPECEAIIDSLAEECKRMGRMNHCRACDGRFDSLAECLDCPDCGTYPLADVAIHRLHRYRFDEERRGWLDRLVGMRDELVTALEGHGYEVELGDGRSDAALRADLHATESTFGVDLAVAIRNSLDVETITDLQAVVEDTETRPVVATAGESGSAATLAEEHGITVVEFDTERDRAAGESLAGSDRRTIDGLFAKLPGASGSRAAVPQ